MLASVEKYIAIVGIGIIAVVVVGLLAHHAGYTSAKIAFEVAAQKSVNAANAKADALAIQLATEHNSSVVSIEALKHEIASQSPQEKIVYVTRTRTVAGKPEIIKVPVTVPVFITFAAVRLYDRSLGLLPAAAGVPAATSGEVPSAVSVSDYEHTTLGNNVACLANTTQLTELIRWVRALPSAPTLP